MSENTNSDTNSEEVSEVSQAPVVQKQRGRPVDPNSGLARARALWATLPNDESRTRASVIAAFVSQLSLSKDTAAAYYSVINRK